MLKKLNIIFIILVTFLLFYIKFNEFNKDYAVSLYSPSTTYVSKHENTTLMTLPIELNVQGDSQSKKESLLSVLSKIDRLAILHSKTNTIDENYLTYTNYIYGSIEDIVEDFVMTESHGYETQYYISNDVSDSKNTHLIEYLDPRYYDLKSAYELKVVLQPITDIDESLVLEMDSIRISFLVDDSDKVAFVKDVSEALGIPLTLENFDTITHAELQGMADVPWYISAFEQPKPVLYISSISLFIILLLDFKKNNKEITIRKLHGNKSNTIFSVLFLRTILANVSALFLTIGLTFAYYVHSFSTLSYRFIRYLLPSILLFAVILFVLMFLFYLILKFIGTITALKKSQQHYISFYSALLIKMLCVLILAVPLIDSVELFLNTKQSYDNIKSDLPAQQKATISFLSYDDSDILERNFQVFTIISENDLGLRDMSEYDEIKIQESWLEEQDSDSLFSVEMWDYTNGHNTNIPFMMMNQHSIRDYNFMDETGNPIVISQYKDVNWVLAPLNYQDEILENGIKCFDVCEIVYYQNVVAITPLDSAFGLSHTESKLIYVMNDYTDTYIYNFGITTELENEKIPSETTEVIDKLQALFPLVNPAIVYGSDIYTINQAAFFEALVSMIIQILLTLFLISVFVYTYLSVYFDFKGKILVIKYLNGIPFEKRYFHIFATMIISNILTVTGMLWMSYQNTIATFQFSGWLHWQTIKQYAFFAIMIESILLLLTIILFQQKKTNLILKGE